ncbi:MAG: hypothetical protein WD904_06950 [Dehalococcoidia bacterium]
MSIVAFVSLLSGLAALTGFFLRFVDIDRLSARTGWPQGVFIGLAVAPIGIATVAFILVSLLGGDGGDDTGAAATQPGGFTTATATPAPAYAFNAFSRVYDQASGQHEDPIEPAGTIEVCEDGEVFASISYDRVPIGLQFRGVWLRESTEIQDDNARNDRSTGNLWWRLKPVDIAVNHFQVWRGDDRIGDWQITLHCANPGGGAVTVQPNFPVTSPAPPTATPSPTPGPQFSFLGFSTGTQDNAPPPVVQSGATINCSIDTLYAWAHHENLPSGQTLSAKWTYNGEHLPSGDSSFTNENPADDIFFGLQDQTWENGLYHFEETLAGAVVVSGEVTLIAC